MLEPVILGNTVLRWTVALGMGARAFGGLAVVKHGLGRRLDQ
jgi:hypothetical protein